MGLTRGSASPKGDGLGPMAEWLRRGLQILARRFDSGSGLHLFVGSSPISTNDTSRGQALNPWRAVRIVLWLAVAAAAIGLAVLTLRQPAQTPEPASTTPPATPFSLVDSAGRPWSSAALTGRPHAIFFGFTRCGDVCPTTLGRLARLRRQAGGDLAFDILFVTIDPANDGPAEVGQYATLFDAPMTGLTGSQAQIDAAKARYGIHAEPTPHAGPGMEMAHTSSVLLFDRSGAPAGRISASDSDSQAIAKLRAMLG